MHKNQGVKFCIRSMVHFHRNSVRSHEIIQLLTGSEERTSDCGMISVRAELSLRHLLF